MAEITELSALIELSEGITESEIMQIQTIINLPAGLCKDAEFFSAIERWKEHSPYMFYLALKDMRPDLIPLACEIPWLCVSTPSEFVNEGKELTIKTLIGMLKSEIPRDKWGMIYIVIAKEPQEDVDFEITLNMLVENGYIQADLKKLFQIMKAVKRDDIVEKLKPYQKAFSEMGDAEFEWKFKRETQNQGKEVNEWKQKLIDFSISQYTQVKLMLGDDEVVSLAKVFVDLTILKQKPKGINMEDETTYNEIAYLRKIANKEVKIDPGDFTNELKEYKMTKPEIWCLIGNPGCGKTILVKRTALRFSNNELVGMKYSISIPCRNTEWHAMESTRHEGNRKVKPEFIQNWLCLGLPIGSSWANDLAKHLSQSDGEGLLLIIDGLDEFPKKVPFKDTFLCLLLTRQSFTKATIILTSRPGVTAQIIPPSSNNPGYNLS